MNCLLNPYPNGQGNWRWCHKCEGLFYAGNPFGGEQNWRWCHKFKQNEHSIDFFNRNFVN